MIELNFKPKEISFRFYDDALVLQDVKINGQTFEKDDLITRRELEHQTNKTLEEMIIDYPEIFAIVEYDEI